MRASTQSWACVNVRRIVQYALRLLGMERLEASSAVQVETLQFDSCI